MQLTAGKTVLKANSLFLKKKPMPSGKVKLSLFFGSLLWILPFSSCSPKLEAIPYEPVNVTILIIPQLANVGILQSTIISGGVEGILIFHTASDTYEAYDLDCMYKPRSEPCRIVLDKTGLTPQCPCCKSTYSLLLEGSPQSGPAQQNLHQYNVYQSGNLLTISN